MTVRVTLAGRVGVEVDGLTVDDTGLGRPARLALAYLVCERLRPVPRDELADVLWGDDLPRSWGQLLRGIVSKLRSLLGAAGLDPATALTSTLGTYRLELGPEVTIDVEDAARRVADAEAALARGEAEVACEWAALAVAVAARQFLPGASGVWVERRQAELRELRLQALDVLSGAEEARGRWSAAVAAAEEAIGLEPFRESAYLRLMAAHAAAGSRGEALRAYERCRRVLAHELGVSPSASTEAAHLRLLGDEPTPPETAPAADEVVPLPPALAVVPGAFLVGREAESGRLATAFELARDGVRQAVLVAGEPGIGKTALVADAARRAHLCGARVLYGRCDEGMGVAYQPFAEALGHYVATCPLGDLTRHAAIHGGELSRLVPELVQRLPRLAPGPVTDPEADRYRLFEATAAFLLAASSSAPVVVVVDDLHWATNATLLLLRHLIRDPKPGAVMIVGTYRQSEVDESHPLAATLADLRRDPEGVIRLRLDGLDADGVAAFVRAAGGGHVGDEVAGLAQALYAHTAGNPFFVGQLLAHISETGAVYRRAGQWSFYADTEGLAVPEGVKEVVARRIHRLSDAASGALTLAAVMGTEFDLELVEAVSDRPVGVLDAIEEAVAAHLVVELASGHYRFAHALVRDTIYSGLTTTRRGRLHRRIGEALESLPGRDDGPRLPALAFHFAEAASAGTALKAADYALAAGRQAVAHAAWEDAAAVLDRGLEALEALDAPDLERRGDMLLLLAETWTRFFDPQRAAAPALAAAEVASSLHSPERLGWAAHWYFRAAPSRGWDADVSTALAEEALAGLGQASPALRARLLTALAWLHGPPGQISPARVEEALALARRSGDPGALGVALSAACGALRGSPNAHEHLAMAEELVSAAPPDGWDGWRNGHSSRAMARLALGDRAGFEADAAECERFGAERRFWYFRWIGALWQAGLALLDGRFAEVEALGARALAFAPPGDLGMGAEFFQRQLVRLHLERGDMAGALALATELVQGWPSNQVGQAMLAFATCQAEVDDARADLEAFADEGLGPMASERQPVALAYRSEVAVTLGGVERSRRLYAAFRPYAGQLVIGGMGEGCQGAVDRYLGMLAASAGDWDDAAAHYEAALRIETEVRSPPLLARTQSWYGRMLLDRGQAADVDRANALLRASLATAEGLGMARLSEEARCALARSA